MEEGSGDSDDDDGDEEEDMGEIEAAITQAMRQLKVRN